MPKRPARPTRPNNPRTLQQPEPRSGADLRAAAMPMNPMMAMIRHPPIARPQQRNNKRGRR